MQIKRIIFGLGSNLGDKQSYLDQAVAKLTALLDLKNIKESSIYKNQALLLPDSPEEWNQEFFNIAVSADIDIDQFTPEHIIDTIGQIEQEIGRQKRQRWAPREIDIDILTIEDLVINLGDKLIVPHYDLLNRNFFLETIKEIEPDWRYPEM